MRQLIHEMLADVPVEEVEPDGALEGVPAVQQDGVGLRLKGLINGRIQAGEAPNARVFLGNTYCTLWTHLVETGMRESNG